MIHNKKPRGRNGGRKPTNAAPMAKIPVTIRRDQAEWLAGKNRSEQVRDALDLLIEKITGKVKNP